MMLLVHHAIQGAALPAFRGVPRANGRIVRFRGSAARNNRRERRQQKHQQKLCGAKFHVTNWPDVPA